MKKDLFLVSGFLGAGKTTFTKNFIELFNEKKLGIIVNEFGQQGIDGALYQDTGIKIQEISNGSVFCNCKVDKFIDALALMSEYPVDTVIVESSGLSDPTSMINVMTIVQKKTKDNYNYRGNITIVDATNFEKVYHTAQVSKLQVLSSDIVLINKSDLVDEEKINELIGLIQEINPYTRIEITTYGRIKSKEWVTNLEKTNNIFLDKTSIKNTMVPQKICVDMKGNYKKDDIARWIKEFSNYFYRIKGFVCIEGTWHYVDGTTNKLSITKTSIKPDNATIVVLSSIEQLVKERIMKSWKIVFNEEIRFLQ